MINLQGFISKHITCRTASMFTKDIDDNKAKLNKEIFQKSVLVIGGAGTIGSSFIRAILKYKPSRLIVVDINENGLTELTRDLRSTAGLYIPAEYVTYPFSYADPVFEKMFRNAGGFDIVANFSAHKHVRSEKDRYSVEALLQNNVIKAKVLLDLLCKFPPKHFFCVSTDKAANPVNIMGGSKKMMEDLIMAYSDKLPITTARFANVAFSNGSLLAGFIERLMKKQPLSAPSDVQRYFVSPEESGEICMLACVLGESGDIYFPKLHPEQMLTFSEIATRLLTELGYQLKLCTSEDEAKEIAAQMKDIDKVYPVCFMQSDTTGEKDFEEFHTDTESVDRYRYDSLGVIKTIRKKSISEIEKLIHNLNRILDNTNSSKADIINVMNDFLVNFDHQELGRYLDSKM